MATMFPVLFEGDVVTYGRGTTLYKITRVKQVKCLAVESGTGRRVELRMEHCRKADDPSKFVGREIENVPTLSFGMAVKFRRPQSKARGVYVVIGQTSGGWKVARLGGGDGNRYFYNLDASDLVAYDEINEQEWSLK